MTTADAGPEPRSSFGGPEGRLEAWPARAQLRPGEPLDVLVRGLGGPGSVQVVVRDATAVVSERTIDVVTPSADGGSAIRVDLPRLERAGLSIEVRTTDQRATSAIDIARHWSVAPRYGFCSDFGPDETLEESKRRLDAMLRLHIDVVQMYDWMASHHTLVADTDEFVDPLGRRLSHAICRRKVGLAHERGMAVLGYGALYGAEREFAQRHPGWLLRDGLDRPIALADLFYLQDVSQGSPWRDWIIGQYRDALDRMGFDGIHIDQYGFPKQARSDATGTRRIVDVGASFPPFVEDACLRLIADRPEGGSIFNCVNGWPLEGMAEVHADAATYIEVWEPSTRYGDLYRWIQHARTLRPDKAVVLAAYLAPFATGRDAGVGALHAFRLASAAIGASGGFHLIAGEGDALLTEAYYPRYGRLDPTAWETVRRYADFGVRNTTRLHDIDATDLAWTHVGPTNDFITLVVPGLAAYGAGAVPGSIWVVCRQQGDVTMVQLIDLRAVTHDAWNSAQPISDPYDDVEVRIRVVSDIIGMWWDTPDDEVGVARALPFEITETTEGRVALARIPRLTTWTSVWWRSAS